MDQRRRAPGAKDFAERVDHACNATYGHAGPMFMTNMIRVIETKQHCLNFLDRFCRTAGGVADVSPNDGQVQRVLRRFSLAALAGDLATRFGLTGWTPRDAHTAAHELFLDWFEAREGTTNEEIATAVTRTRDHVSTHLDRFQTIGTTDHDPVDGWRDGDWIYIRSDCWQKMHADHDPTHTARLHADGGLLKTKAGGGYQVRMGRSISGRPWAYAVNASKLLGAART